jgi:hypothetical protein
LIGGSAFVAGLEAPLDFLGAVDLVGLAPVGFLLGGLL